ncbi:MAG: MBL fold metallo-hydrolase [Alphaproteobacteria bacterium]|nr:MBL fold metallo-hydrolase [Alphaproteobacteria bacterium]MDE1986671.1 MBL fold metallo-hydrolase [Alphaproteobacteria bacterium]MDE2161910.1 MBL fold metallo-hydrolase [Alphaproteobacteria bacterium]MDE2264502.1 MBL fold metallo-hydrolase [Alphaproteobacteria bacterium]MDE2500823.1 MBL fold metallo-hydrolase [Alphaproteobacteria bacterium]
MSDRLEVTILGCGSSGGVPRLGGIDGSGNWGVCDSANPKNRRTRCSILVRRHSPISTTCVLVDTAPDLREQLLRARASDLNGVLITHDHADQINGIDDLRVVAMHQRRRVNLHADTRTGDSLLSRFSYCFVQAAGSDYPPIAKMHAITEPFRPFGIDGAGGTVPVLAFGQAHGSVRSLGFRFGPVAYSPDVNALDDAAFATLEGVDIWIVDALRYTPHPSHSHVDQSLEWIARVKPNRAILTNLHVDLDYETLKRELPPNVEPAFDGMVLNVGIAD